MRSVYYIFAWVLALSLGMSHSVVHAQAQAGDLSPYFSFDGVLKDNTGNPIISPTTVTFGIYDAAGSCLLYQESQLVNPSTNGSFAVFIGSPIGSTKRTAGVDRSLPWKAIFQNSTTLQNICSGGTTPYTPNAGDARKLRVTIAGTALTPDFNIASVPSATTAETLQGKLPSDFLTPASGANLTQANLESVFTGTNYTSLSNLINGTSTVYAKSDGSNLTAAFNLNNQRITNLVSPTAANDAVNKTYADTNIGGRTSSGLTSLAGGGDIGKVLSWNGTQWVAQVASATDATKLPLTGGTMTGPLNMGGLLNMGGFTINGNSAASGNLILESTSNATKGSIILNAAGGNVGIGTTIPSSSAILDIMSTNRGLLIPRMNTVSRDGISTPAAGLQVYNTSTNSLNYYDGSTWQSLGTAGAGLSSLNGQNGSTQTFAFSSTGIVSPTWDSAASIHNLKIPMASAAGVTAGLLSKTDYDFFTAKLSTSLPSGMLFVGSVGSIATPTTITGDVTFNNTGLATIAGNAITTSKISNGAISLEKMAGSVSANSILLSNGMGTGLSSLSCVMGQTLQFSAGVPICSSMRLPTGGGTAGQFLSIDAGGNSSWEDVNLGTNFSGTGNPNGLSSSASMLILHAASPTTPGAVSTGAQQFGGAKTFEDAVSIGTLAGSSATMLTTNGVAVFRNNSLGSATTLVLENLDGTAPGSGTAIEMKGQLSATPKPLVRLKASQVISNEGTFDIETFNGGYASRLKVMPDGRVNIGNTSAGPTTAQLNVFSDNFTGSLANFTGEGNSNGVLKIQRYSPASNIGPQLMFLSSRGSLMSPSPTPNDDTIGAIVFRGSTPSPSTGGATIRAIASQPFTGAANGTSLAFHVTQMGQVTEMEAMRILPNGNVGFGMTAPAYKVDVIGDINASGLVRAATVALSSDRRYKKDIRVLDSSLEKLLKIRGVSYDWRKEQFPEKHFSDRHQVGVIAQEVEAQFPELVDTNKEGYKAVNYSALIAPVIESIRTLYRRIVATENHLADQNRQLASVAANKADRAEIEMLKAQNARLHADLELQKQENLEMKARLDQIEKLLNK